MFGQVAWYASFSFKLFLISACLSPCEHSLLHCCSGEERNQRGDKAFKLVPDFSRILLSVVARCVPVFTIQWEDKDYARKGLTESRASKTGRDSWNSDIWLSWTLSDSEKRGRPFHQLLWEKCLLPRDGNDWLVSEKDRKGLNSARIVYFIEFPSPVSPSIPEKRQDIR